MKNYFIKFNFNNNRCSKINNLKFNFFQINLLINTKIKTLIRVVTMVVIKIVKLK